MELRQNIDEVMDRTIRFCSNGAVGDALVKINYSHKGYPVKGLDQWQFPNEMEAFLDENITRLTCAWQGREALDDDSIPALFPRYGIAEHSAFVAGEVDFTVNSSWPHPVIHDYSELDTLELREGNMWLRLVIDGLAYLREKGDGKFAVKQRGVMSPMDVANALRGNDMFSDFYTYPDELRRLLSFCVDACEWFISRQKAAIGDFYGGAISGTDVWMPGNAIGHLSEDASVMCSPATYREFGKPYTERLLEPYDAAFMHLHTAGTQAFEPIVEMETLTFFELAPDPKQPRGVHVYEDHFELFRNSVMKLFITFDEMKENIAFLKRAKTVLVCNADSMEEAQAIVKFVRRELPVL